MQTEKEIRENLSDAGCSESCIRSFLELRDSGESAKAGRVLENHRRELLNELHESQRKLDCLDYLSWNLKKEGRL